jgi:hypothetical protein
MKSKPVCDSLILFALFTRSAAIPLYEQYLCGPLYARDCVSRMAFRARLHKARTDVSMVFGLVFLLLVGADP